MKPALRPRALLASALLLAAALPLPADVLVLRDGKKIEGDVIDAGDAYAVKTKYGTLTVGKAEVLKVVKPPDRIAAQAETVRKLGREMCAKALELEDAKERQGRLEAGVELLKKALAICTEAREVYVGDAYHDLDTAADAIRQEIRSAAAKIPAAAPPESPKTPDKPAPPLVPPPPKADTLDAPPPPKAADAGGASKAPGTADPARLEAAARLVADARAAADRKRYADARSLASRVVSQYPGTAPADEAQALLDSIPHPDGRLVCGFDTKEDLAKWETHKRSNPEYAYALATDPKEIREGAGAARFTLGRNPDAASGCIVLPLEKFDAARFRAVSLWVFSPQPGPGQLEIAFLRKGSKPLPWIDSDDGFISGDSLYFTVPLNWAGWRQVKVPAALFQSRKKMTWQDVGALEIYDSSRKGFDVILDSLRFLEVDKT